MNEKQLEERVLRLEQELLRLRRSHAGLEVGAGLNRLGQDTEIHGDLTVSGAIHGSVPWAQVTGRPLGYYWVQAPINPGAGLSAGSHVFTRATHFPSVPAEATHIEIGVLFRWNATPSTSNRAYINDGPGWPIYVPHTTSWYEPAQQAKVKLDANQAFTLKIEGANMDGSYIYLRGYWA